MPSLPPETLRLRRARQISIDIGFLVCYKDAVAP
jgi:hypothetical protein